MYLNKPLFNKSVLVLVLVVITNVVYPPSVDIDSYRNYPTYKPYTANSMTSHFRHITSNLAATSASQSTPCRASVGAIYGPTTDPEIGITAASQTITLPNGSTSIVSVAQPLGITTATTCYVSVMGTNGTPSTPDKYFPSVVSQAVSEGYRRIVFPEAVYNFSGPQMSAFSSCNADNYSGCAPHWVIGGSGACTADKAMCYPLSSNLHDLDLDLSSSVLNFNAPTMGIVINYANRVKLGNLTIDYPHIQVAALGTVIRDPNGSSHKAISVSRDYPVNFTPANFTMNGYPEVQAVDLWTAVQKSADVGRFYAPAHFNDPSNEIYFVGLNVPPTYMGSQTSTTISDTGTRITTTYSQVYSCNPTGYANPPVGAKDCGFVSSPPQFGCGDFYHGCANFDQIPLGASVVLRYFTYNGSAITIFTAGDVSIENMTMLSSPGSGVGVGASGGYGGV